MSYAEYGIGATTVGIRVKNAVVLASEKRMSYGGFVFSKMARKVYKITDNIGIAFAGLYADMQALVKILKGELQYYMLTLNKRPRVSAAAKLLSAILYSSKLIPFITEVLVGGIDDGNVARLYVLDPVGSLIEDDFAALGSGAAIAIGVLEAEYKPDLPPEKAKELAVKAIRVAMERDPLSGDGIDVLLIYAEESGIKSIEEHIRVPTSS